MRRSKTKGIGLRTKFSVKKKKNGLIHIQITTKQSNAEPRVYKCSKGQAKRCSHSKSHKCTCACRGHNHGTKRRWPKILSWT